jgi:hypothetical protein
MRNRLISACVVHPHIGLADGAIMIKPGFYRYPNNNAARYRAGAASDLARIAGLRMQGDKKRCRELLAFCRDVRVFQSGGKA